MSTPLGLEPSTTTTASAPRARSANSAVMTPTARYVARGTLREAWRASWLADLDLEPLARRHEVHLLSLADGPVRQAEPPDATRRPLPRTLLVLAGNTDELAACAAANCVTVAPAGFLALRWVAALSIRASAVITMTAAAPNVAAIAHSRYVCGSKLYHRQSVARNTFGGRGASMPK